jgi:adenylate cyclase
MVALSRSPASVSPLLRGSLAQRLRIGCGLILFTFVLFHFLNHALGLWSITAMDTFQEWRTAITRSTLGTIVLGAALVTHIGLNLWKIAGRSTWRLPPWEAVQIGLGLLIPLLLFVHLSQMRGHHIMLGIATSYTQTLADVWNNAALRQTTLLLVVWTHGCIGLHFWLRLSRYYHRIAPLLLGLAVLVPALALAGFLVAGRQAAATAAATQAATAAPSSSSGYDEYGGGYDDYGGGYDDYGGGYGAPQPVQAISDAVLDASAWYTAWALLALVAITLAIRALLRRGRRRIRVGYTAGRSVVTPVGPTLLEISRAAGIPHTSVCGGRARCSTCRVKVEDGGEALPPPSAAEAATLKNVRAANDVRLACQLRPQADLTVTRLVRPPEMGRGLAARAEDGGVERTLAILFLDIRGFTSLSEARLPYDTVFLLNRFFGEVGEAVTAAGGWIDKYMGDGMMALFGLNQPIEGACRGALTATVRIDAALERINAELAGELAAPLKIGIGLHIGPLVLGRIGHRASAATTVIGPAVNVTSRLESLTKEHGVQVIASSELVRTAGLPVDAPFPEIAVTVRGATEPVAVRLVARGGDLAPYLGEPRVRAAA